MSHINSDGRQEFITADFDRNDTYRPSGHALPDYSGTMGNAGNHSLSDGSALSDGKYYNRSSITVEDIKDFGMKNGNTSLDRVMEDYEKAISGQKRTPSADSYTEITTGTVSGMGEWAVAITTTQARVELLQGVVKNSMNNVQGRARAVAGQ